LEEGIIIMEGGEIFSCNDSQPFQFDGLSVNPDGIYVNSEGSHIAGFIYTLYGILTLGHHGDCIEFSERGINVTDVERFTSTVLPVYYKHSSFTSFVRQLNFHEFMKTKRDPCSHEYRNPHFIKGNTTMLALIKRAPTRTRGTDITQKRRALQVEELHGPSSSSEVSTLLSQPLGSKEELPPPVTLERLEIRLTGLIQDSARASARLSALEDRCSNSDDTAGTVWSDSNNFWGVLAQGAPDTIADLRRPMPPIFATSMANRDSIGDGAAGTPEMRKGSASKRQKKQRKKKANVELLPAH